MTIHGLGASSMVLVFRSPLAHRRMCGLVRSTWGSGAPRISIMAGKPDSRCSMFDMSSGSSADPRVKRHHVASPYAVLMIWPARLVIILVAKPPSSLEHKGELEGRLHGAASFSTILIASSAMNLQPLLVTAGRSDANILK